MIQMDIKALIALAKAQKADKKTVEEFAQRVQKREKEFEAERRQQAVTAEFLARRYSF
jgi:hypothetical protein